LPADIQEAVVHAVPGLERAVFLRHGYAVEYDVVAPGQVGRDLVCRDLPGLALAGQVLGTSGYEEAAALGLLAGINAARWRRGREPLVIGRDQAYLGVLVDDLVLREHVEPYRMFTSRAEHRLLLGVDSARERLMATGRDLGLVREDVFHVEHRRWTRRREAGERLEADRLTPDAATVARLRRELGIELTGPASWAGLFRRQDVDRGAAMKLAPALEGLDPEDRLIVVGTARYRGYLERHRREAERIRRLRGIRFPAGFDPKAVPGLSREIVEQLAANPPATLSEAERLPGMTPAAVAILAGVITRGTEAP
jgi:tRNA uridine 5-carboxymethylaminomethyl modification enzyme